MEWSEQTSSSILPASRFSRSVAIQRFRFGFVQGEQLAGQIPQVLASVKEIDNLNCAGEVLRGDVPDPFGSVADRHFLSRPAPAAIPGLDRAAFRTLQPFRWRRYRWSSPGRGWGNLPRPIWSGETRIPAWLRAWGPSF